MTNTVKYVLIAAAVVFGLLVLGAATGVLTPDTSAPTYNNANGGS